jgi:phospholipase C
MRWLNFIMALAATLTSAVSWGRSPSQRHLEHAREKARKKIRHVIVIMQENRSFDSFGTYPHADGFPMRHGVPVCVPDPATDQCVQPFHDPNDSNHGGPHRAADAVADMDGGRMDGFVAQAAAAMPDVSPDVMGYHDAREIPNYWAYAWHFVLQDHMFEPNASWSLPEHLFMVSAWSAKCSRPGDPSSCTSALDDPPLPGPGTHHDWTDLTYLLHKNSWAYYLSEGTEPDCEDDAATCTPKSQNVDVPGIWNPLPWFTTVHQDGQLGNIQPTANFLTAAKTGTLPARLVGRAERGC